MPLNSFLFWGEREEEKEIERRKRKRDRGEGGREGGGRG
jgi:hypothetical protein